MYTAQVVDLQQVQGEALEGLLRAAAERAARDQYGCVVLHELERRVRDFWAVPGDLQGHQVVVSRWETQRLPPPPQASDRTLTRPRGQASMGGHELRVAAAQR